MRKSSGRKKVAIEKIQKQSNLQVTFSKRRAGLFKKATELSTLCGGEIATVIFSPTNVPYSIGYPSFDFVVDKFLGVNTPTNTDGPNPRTEVNEELIQMEKLLEEETNRRETLQAIYTEGSLEVSDKELVEILEAKLKEVKLVANQQKEHGVTFSYSTYGDALAPREYHLPNFNGIL